MQGGSIYVSKGNYARLQLSTHDALKLYSFMYNQQDSLKRVFEKYVTLRNNAAVV